MSTKPIGIFDSGIGGTSVFKEIRAILPHEAFIYLADSVNAPYGHKSKEEILKLSIKNTELLLDKGCKLIVVACNTATTNAISYLRANYNVPFIGIEPAIKPAAIRSKTKTIGILATKGTLSSELFHKTTDLHAATGIKIIEQVGDGIVPLIESGMLESNKMKVLLNSYIEPMLEAKIDYLVLGCTHYPYLIPLLSKRLPKSIKIIDSGMAVAKQTKKVLKHNRLLNDTGLSPKILFYSNGTISILKKILNSRFRVKYLDF